MKEVIEEAVRLLEQGEECVMATVVKTRGSTPQKPGAKLLVRKDGSGVGTLGGGCVEGDIWFAAQELLRRGGGPEYRDYLLNEEIAARDGLVCGGTMYFFLEPLREPAAYLPYGRQMLESYQGGRPAAVATLVKGGENTGARLMLWADGSALGSLGSAELDGLAREAARRVTSLGTSEDLVASPGVEIFVEGFTTPPTLVVMGGGHVGRATSRLAHTLGFRIYIVDDRLEFSNPIRFPEAEGTIVSDYGHGLDTVPVNANTFILVATRGHRYDDLALEAAINTPASYVGLMGSRRKTLLIYQRLLAQGVSPERLKAVRSPVGLNIGAITPEELAVSIMAEIIMHQRGAPGGPMKMEERHVDRALEKALAAAPSP